MDTKTILKIIEELNKVYDVKLRHGKPFDILIHGILSARTKDEISFPAQERLFKLANTPGKILKLSTKQIEKAIYPVGFYRVKAKRIKEACKFLVKNFKGNIPKDRESLMKIPGVGGKIADIILLFAYSQDVVPVDVHVAVVSKRLGITKNNNPEKIREDLHKIIPKKFRAIVNQLFVQFGKEICQTRKPLCYKCPIINLCPYEPKNLKN